MTTKETDFVRGETFEAGLARALRALSGRVAAVFIEDQTPPEVAVAVLLVVLRELSTGPLKKTAERQLLAQSGRAAAVLLKAFDEKQRSGSTRRGAH